MSVPSDRSDAFISYSRRDSDFVRQIFDRLKQDGRNVWVDWEDIPLTVDWWQEIERGIERAGAFIFIISPDSVCSDVCFRELDYAVKNGKRFIPVLHRPINDLPQDITVHPVINTHNWIHFSEAEEFEDGYRRLIGALESDPSYVRSHTNLLVKAHEWEEKGRIDSLLLRGEELQKAETFIAAPRSSPRIVSVQVEYVVASRRATNRRQRFFAAGMGVVAFIMFGLALLSFTLFRQSEQNLQIASTSEALALAAGTEAAVQADLASKNELQANRAAVGAATSEARAGLRATDVFIQAATSDANAALAATNAARAELNEQAAYQRATEVANQVATSDANAALASANEEEALLKSTEVVQQAATAQAFADLAVTSAARAEQNEKRAQSIALSAQSLLANYENNEPLAVLLAIEALESLSTWEAEKALAEALPFNYSALNSAVAWAEEYVTTAPDKTLQVRTGGGNDRIAYVETMDGETLYELRGHTEPIVKAVWSPDGRRLVTLSEDDTARVWDATNGALERVLLGHEDNLLDAAWSPGGRHLVTAGEDNVLRYWNIHGGEPTSVELEHDLDDLTEIVFANNGHDLVGVRENDSRVIWHLWESPQHLLDIARDCCVTRDFTDEEARAYGFPPPVSAPPPEQILQCEDTLESQMYPGVRGTVNSVNNLIPLNLRDAPDGELIGKIQPDQTFLVIEGPACEAGYAWFKVVYGLEGRTGWVAEGQMTDGGTADYFALPVRAPDTGS